MVISKKPIGLLAVMLLGMFTSVTMANTVTDTTHTTNETTTPVEHVVQETEETHAVAHVEEGHEALSPKEKITEHIQHHLLDSYDFTLFSDEETGHSVGFSLPVILIDNGLKVFSASKFEHGKAVANVDGNYYKVYHNKIYKTDAAGTLEMHEGHPINEKPLDFSITKNVFSLLLTALILILLFSSLAKTYKKGPNALPTGFSRVLEPLVIFVRDEIARPNIGEKKYKKFMPYLLTVFFLIWLLNLIGLTPLGINVTGNIAVTFCLAICTLIITNFSANKDYWGHIFWMPGVPVPMKLVLAPIEILGIFTKPFSLMIRLFANITAGHSVVMGLIAIIFLFKQTLTTGGSIGVSMLLTTFISVIELLVAFLQAFIFTMLSSLFIGMAVQDHHHDEDHTKDGLGEHDNAIV
ncbi:F0F1 ATP synthase subunit A [Flavobacterium agrisoli]|uniref:ATP synthase subunit a n=1 Tax=Flavobacterium agrisoli TaxID=2793066 RepID=A0A934PK32_9FLAO|nr:F0F1 ATP synthase subunit A [Flavobacterium agrisoli]MBK0369596.1 F0F1 ATP synthase subunit A [Flavobacterium agrisoli]